MVRYIFRSNAFIIMTFDIIEFELLDGKIYLFAMIDCFAEMGLGWTIGAHPMLI